MKSLIVGFALTNARFVEKKYNVRPGPPPGDDMTKKANGLCKDFFRDFHGVTNPDLVTNVEINNGNQGSVSLKLRFEMAFFLRTPWTDRNIGLRAHKLNSGLGLSMCM